MNLLKHREGNGVYKDYTAIYTRSVGYKNLLIVVRETQEPWLGIVEGVFIVKRNVVFVAFIGANSQSFLRETHILLNIPDL